MKRRQILQLAGFSLTALNLGASRARAATPVSNTELAALQSQWQQLRAAGTSVVEPAPALTRSHDEWRGELPGDAYDVLFEEDTERPFASSLNDEKRPGLFVCRACNLPLFTSLMKYDSGSGWPSFFTSIPGHLATKTDFKLVWPRTEYHCIKCGGHQGHMFDDGPPPTGQRWCNNGLALAFIPFAG